MKKITTPEQLKKWANGFSATVLRIILVLWAVSMVFGMFVIAYSLLKLGTIEEPVNFISEINATFGSSVVAILVTRTIGNIFEYNDGALFGTSHREE